MSSVATLRIGRITHTANAMISTPIHAKWVRVSKANRCPICDRADYCRIGFDLVHCMRVPSATPSKCSLGGYLHPLNGNAVAVPRHDPPPRPTIDAAKLARQWFERTSRQAYDRLAELLGVSVDSLRALRCGWAEERRAWGWPMVNGAGDIVGIRLRTEDGRKFSVTGGHEGVFLPAVEPYEIVWSPEGASDCAALLTLGKFAIARPSCTGGIAHLSATIARLGIRKAVIIADNDPDKLMPNGKRWNPGLDGAQRLANDIGVPCCIVVLPTKDSREFLRLGGTSELLDSIVSGLVWYHPPPRRKP
jgi:hypothetical protein